MNLEESIEYAKKEGAYAICRNCGVMAICQPPKYLKRIKSLEDGHIETVSPNTWGMGMAFVDEVSMTPIGNNQYCGKFKISPLWKTLPQRRDLRLVESLDVCPCCGEPYESDLQIQTSFFWNLLSEEHKGLEKVIPSARPWMFKDDPSNMYRDYDSKVRYSITKKFGKEIIEECENTPFEAEVVSKEAVENISVPDFIKKFIEVEALITSCKERIEFLDEKNSPCAIYSSEEYHEKIYDKAFNMRYEFAFPLEDRKIELTKKLAELKGEIKFNPEKVELKAIEPVKPVEPKVPKRPKSPELQKVTLFNKAKATAENEKLMTDYNSDLQIYVNEKAVYDKKIEEYEKAISEYEKAFEAFLKAKEEELALAKEAFEKVQNSPEKALMIAAIENELKDIQKQFKELPEKCLELVEPKEYKDYFVAINEELEQVKILLRKAVGAKNFLVKCGVIHPKYANLEALASINEYYETGRTDTLTGLGGAYNLYEQEVQAKTIVKGLNKIAGKLTSIESAQYSILYTLKDMKENTEKLLTNIADNTARIAYNSAVTAHYTKLNSQLLNSVGMMIALK